MNEYRCKHCKNLLFIGNLPNGSKVEAMCKKKILREASKDSKPTKWRKCKTMNIFS